MNIRDRLRRQMDWFTNGSGPAPFMWDDLCATALAELERNAVETEVPHTAHCVKRLDDIGCDCGSGHKPDCQLATAVCTCGADAPASPVKSTTEPQS